MAGLLDDLPRKGILNSPARGAVVRRAVRHYVCQHSTLPPEDQIVSTDPTNILIRSLKMRQNADSQNKGRAQAKAKAAAGIKRNADDGPLTEQNKRHTNQSRPAAAGSRIEATFSRPQLQAMRIPELQTELRSRGLTVSGNKSELVERLLAAQTGTPR